MKKNTVDYTSGPEYMEQIQRAQRALRRRARKVIREVPYEERGARLASFAFEVPRRSSVHPDGAMYVSLREHHNHVRLRVHEGSVEVWRHGHFWEFARVKHPEWKPLLEGLRESGAGGRMALHPILDWLMEHEIGDKGFCDALAVVTGLLNDQFAVLRPHSGFIEQRPFFPNWVGSQSRSGAD